MEQRLLHTITTRGRAVVDFVALAAVLAFLVGVILALAVAIVPAAEPQRPAVPAASVPADSTPPAVTVPDPYAVTEDPHVIFELAIGNRMYPDWKETQSVRLQQEFPIGDTENSARIVRFLPSFMIDHGMPHSMSARMDNPAVRIMVYFNGAPRDSAWAFLNFPPHFSPRSFYTFQLKSVQGYAGGDGTADAQSGMPEGAAPGTKPAAGNPPTSAGNPPTPAGKPK